MDPPAPARALGLILAPSAAREAAAFQGRSHEVGRSAPTATPTTLASARSPADSPVESTGPLPSWISLNRHSCLSAFEAPSALANALPLHLLATPSPDSDFSARGLRWWRSRQGRLERVGEKCLKVGCLVGLVGRQILDRRIQHPAAKQQRANANRYVHDFKSLIFLDSPDQRKTSSASRDIPTRILPLFALGDNRRFASQGRSIVQIGYRRLA